MRKQFQFITIALFAVLSSCQKPNIKEVQQPVFGNLVLGVTADEYKKSLDSLLNLDLLLVNDLGKPYFKLNHNNFGLSSEVYLFPTGTMNAESVITEIRYYVYSFNTTKYDRDLINDENRKHLIQSSIQDYIEAMNLKSSFDLDESSKNNFTPYTTPTVLQNTGYSADQAEGIISKTLSEKYGKGTITTIGNTYNIDSNYVKEIAWKSDVMDITFSIISPAPAPASTRFQYQVLSYRFNKATREKYGLNDKTQDLKQTF